MASGSKWLKARVRELFQGGRNFTCRTNNGALRGSLQFIRLLKSKHGEGRSGSSSCGEHRRADGAQKLLRSECTLRELVANLIDRVHRGVVVDSYDYVHVLQGCSKQQDIESVKQVHDCIRKSHLEQHPYVANNLLKCYIGCGRLQTAQEIFNQLLKKDTVTWTIMIAGCAEHNQVEDAIDTYKQMWNEGGQPNAVTYLSALKACASPTALQWGKYIHAHIIRDGLQSVMRIGTSLVLMYANCGSVEDAKAVFDRMERRDVFSWNVMIGGLAEHGLGREAYCLFLQMQKEGFAPNVMTYVSILNPCSSKDALEWVKEVHAHAMKAGLDVDLRVGTALVHMYVKSGSIGDARVVFQRMKRHDVVSWSVIIGGLAKHGLGHEAFSFFLQMQREGFTPNVITYASILDPCSSEGALRWVKEVHAHAIKAGLDVDERVGTALVDMYAKIGIIADARQVFDKMLNGEVISWTAMIGGLAQHGHGPEALQLYEKMKSKGVKPNRLLFLKVLSACSHAGLVDEGRSQFVSMRRDHGIEPALEHYNCMVDILGRAGHLEEAKRFILHMPIRPDTVTWKTLLGVCSTYKTVELAEVAAKECLKSEPRDASPYVLLSNVYAAVGNWDQFSWTRGRMHERGIRKDPGLSWIEVDNKIHHFAAGDTSHPERSEIYAMLSSLFKKLKAEGYKPDTQLVLWKVGEEDKESTLFFHSEKLALAYGLMHVPPQEPIRIYKNLRICIDCHTVTKLFSKVTDREVLARDSYRFHLFKDGSCSCGDYW